MESINHQALFTGFCLLLLGLVFCLLWRWREANRLQAELVEKKGTEVQLRKLLRAVEQSPASIVITNVEGAIEYVNPKFCALTGYTADEVHGQSPRLLKSGETAAEAYRRMWETLVSGHEWRGEFHNKKKNGELYWESASISPILDDAGQISHFIAVKEDITARKQAEAEREALVKSLEDALANVRILRGLMPICASCKRIRDDQGYWNQVEVYLVKHSEAKFSHGLCPICISKLYPELANDLPPSLRGAPDPTQSTQRPHASDL